MGESKSKFFYDRISHAYDLLADGGEHQAPAQGLELQATGKGESILEIGLGTAVVVAS